MKPASHSSDSARLNTYDQLSRKQIAANLRKHLPLDVRKLHAFVVFKFAPPRKPGGKRSKLPFYVVGKHMRSGEQGSTEDRTHLVSFAEAVKLFESDHTFAGIGVCALKTNDVFFVDLDNCVDTATGEINVVANELIKWRTYTELSPSGQGLRLILRGNPQINKKNHKQGVELFSSKGFVTLTGMPFGKIAHRARPVNTQQLKRLRALAHAEQEDVDQSDINSIPTPLTKDRYPDVKRALKHIDPDCGYAEWLAVGQALHSSDPKPDGRGFELWLRWSQKGDKFAETNERQMLRKWQGFKAGGGVTLASLFAMAQQSGYNVSARARNEIKDEAHPAVLTYTPESTPEITTSPLAEGLFDHYGAYVFIGRAKIGKSRILGALVAAALCGGNALSFKFNQKCKVLALTLEEDPATMLERVRLYGVEPKEHSRQMHIIDDQLAIKASKEYSDEHDWTAWLDLLLRKLKPDLVYIDTAIKMRMLWQNDPAYRSKNVTEQDYQNASLLDEAARKHRCVIVSIIHGSKRKHVTAQHAFDPFESIGTTSWTLAGCTGALVLMDKPGHNALEDEDDGQRVFSVRGRYMPKGDAHYLVQSNQSGTFTNMGEYHYVVANMRTQEYLQFIWESQEQGAEHVTARTVAGSFGRSERTVRVALHHFIESGALYEGRRLEGVQGSGYRLVQTAASRRGVDDHVSEEFHTRARTRTRERA